MGERQIENAIITSAKIGTEDHGFFTIWLSLDYGGTGQGFGGYALAKRTREGREWTGHMAMWVARLLEVADVQSWDKLIGKTVRADHDRSCVYRIGHIVKDDWFDPQADYSKARGEQQ